jgi:mannose/cellobiose epimerase-like protein (N-acyl-D-glucosamine 2-epimerase family)
MGRPGTDVIINHGMKFLWNSHRDPDHGGYYWGVGYDAPSDSTKPAYGHAFVLLAASSTEMARHPDADRLLADISTIIRERFWESSLAPSRKSSPVIGNPMTPIAARTRICIYRVVNGRLRGNK